MNVVENRTVRVDPEVLDLLRRQPDLLAIADAVATTQDRPRRLRRVTLLAAAAAVAAAAGVLAVLAPWQGRAPLVTERALAAIGQGPVIHAIVESRHSRSTVVDLATGEERHEFEVTRIEYWYDAERSLLRTRIFFNGLFETEIVESPRGSVSDLHRSVGPAPAPGLDPALAGFNTRYRSALEDGSARVVGRDDVDGREAILLRIELPHGASEDVAVDSDDYRPLRLRYRQSDGSVGSWLNVLAIESIPYDPSDFAPPKRSAPRPTEVSTSADRDVTPAEAAAALGRRALWPGEGVGRVPLVDIRLAKLTERWTDGRVTYGRVLELRYGRLTEVHTLDRTRAWLSIYEATSPHDLKLPGLERGGGRLPPPGSIRLRGLAGPDDRVRLWVGLVQEDGVYVSLSSQSRGLVLAAGRALRPIG